MLTVKYVEDRVKEIARVGEFDPEVAHSAEDDLVWEVIGSIAENPLGAQELARAVLESLDISFPRWCA